jgi:hypothetical protein
MSAPTPTLKVVDIRHVFPHEEHDPQRSKPLLERLRDAEFLTNPPIVAPMDNNNYVILDGANRYHTLCELGFQHILVQIASYESGIVSLGVWQHVVSHWERVYFIEHLQRLEGIQISRGWSEHQIAQVLLKDGVILSIQTSSSEFSRNELLRQIVAIYRDNAKLDRTAASDPSEVWELYPSAIALVRFVEYLPHDIINAARQSDFLPPGISRHMISGRALKLNYSMAILRDSQMSLEAKNAQLQDWLKNKIEQRAMRYYAESTYQFDE